MNRLKEWLLYLMYGQFPNAWLWWFSILLLVACFGPNLWLQIAAWLGSLSVLVYKIENA